MKRPIKRSLWVLAVSLLTALAVALTSPGKGSAAPTPHPTAPKPKTTSTPKPTPSTTRTEHDDGHSDKDSKGQNRDRDDNEHKKKQKKDDDDKKKKKKKKKDDDDHHHHGKYPPSPPHHCKISNTHPRAGSHVQLGGAGFRRGERVHIKIHSVVQVLGVTTADSAGQALADVAIPADFTGQHELTMTGDASGYTNTVAIQLSAPVKGSQPAPAKAQASHKASPVGAVTAGIGALGLVLLSGAGALLAIGRRRKARANILA